MSRKQRTFEFSTEGLEQCKAYKGELHEFLKNHRKEIMNYSVVVAGTVMLVTITSGGGTTTLFAYKNTPDVIVPLFKLVKSILTGI